MKCPEEKCWHWVPAGGSADMSDKIYPDIETALKKIEWTHFPYGGCSCTIGKCNRIHPDGAVDLFEPIGP